MSKYDWIALDAALLILFIWLAGLPAWLMLVVFAVAFVLLVRE